MFSIIVIAQTNSDAKPPESTVEKIAGLNAKFIVALISDGEGGAWLGTEDEGVFHWQADGKVSQFTKKNGLGDNNGYALAIDKLGRLWVGHLNTGVSVFNGKDWKNYDVVDGPIGERIFDIEICPKDGDVWMATSAGISRYKIDDDSWEHFTREDGLLEDQASALAFLDDGTLIVGTQCHGLAIFNRFANGIYRHKRNITAPDRFGQNISPVPLVPSGNFFHSNLINDILVAQNAPDSKSQGIWIATSTGLIKANNDLTKFEFWRGKDYADKVHGLWGGTPKDFKPAPKEIMDQLLPEDYLTCLAEDLQGVIWIGTRQNGFVVADQKTGQRATGTPKGSGLPDNFVTKLLLLKDGNYLIGFYGGGVVKSKNPFELVTRKPIKKPTSKIRPTFSVAQNDFPKLPQAMRLPTAEELRSTYYQLKKMPVESKPPSLLVLNDDWRTKGDWIDRYGRFAAVLCAQAGGGLNFYDGYFAEDIETAGGIGRNFKAKKDSLRHWIHWLESDDKRVLQCSNLGGRRQSSWDDHKEVYPITLDGPHIYVTCKMPTGKYSVSLYFFNKDGHDGSNRLRDFVVSAALLNLSDGDFEKIRNEEASIEPLFLQAPIVAKTRVKDFWGGEYKRFYVDVKDNKYAVFKIDSNYSFCTIVSGVFFDPAGELLLPDQDTKYWRTRWERVIKNPVEFWWWGYHALDWTLYQRDHNPTWFYKNARKKLLPIARAFVKMENGLPYHDAEIDIEDAVRIRPSLAKLLNYVQLFDAADHVFYGDLKYKTHTWEEYTERGREHYSEYKWNWDIFYKKFVTKKVNQHTWAPLKLLDEKKEKEKIEKEKKKGM
ncbi:MAG: hypothetical protein LBQ66_12290 [Planctomycetaceae bacterium]|nr:hypothetical protein [Planctomycetaceae bacterium]